MTKDSSSGVWGHPAFINYDGYSLGVQLGLRKSFGLLLIDTTNDPGEVFQSNQNFGVEWKAKMVGLDKGTTDMHLACSNSICLNRSKGADLGFAIRGGTMQFDDLSNIVYYHYAGKPQDILFGLHEVGETSSEETNLVFNVNQLIR